MGHRHARNDAEIHPETTHPRHRDGMYIPGTRSRDRADTDSDTADQPGQQIRQCSSRQADKQILHRRQSTTGINGRHRIHRDSHDPAGATTSTPRTPDTVSAATAPSRSNTGSSPVRSTIVDGTAAPLLPPSRYTETDSPNCCCAWSISAAGGLPEIFALETAIGPTSRNNSIATGCNGIRTITVPRVMPRSQVKLGACSRTSDRSPGQQASINFRARCGTPNTRPSIVCHEPTSTPTGMSGTRFFARNTLRTAGGSNASAPMPSTVSVGNTTNSPERTASAAARNPARRPCASSQSNTVLMPQLLRAALLARTSRLRCSRRRRFRSSYPNPSALRSSPAPAGYDAHAVVAFGAHTSTPPRCAPPPHPQPAMRTPSSLPELIPPPLRAALLARPSRLRSSRRRRFRSSYLNPSALRSSPIKPRFTSGGSRFHHVARHNTAGSVVLPREDSRSVAYWNTRVSDPAARQHHRFRYPFPQQIPDTIVPAGYDAHAVVAFGAHASTPPRCAPRRSPFMR